MCSARASKGPDQEHIHTYTPCPSWAAPLLHVQLLKLPDRVELDWIYTSCQTDSYPQQRDHQHAECRVTKCCCFQPSLSHMLLKTFFHFLSLYWLCFSLSTGTDTLHWAQTTNTKKCWRTTLCHSICCCTWSGQLTTILSESKQLIRRLVIIQKTLRKHKQNNPSYCCLNIVNDDQLLMRTNKAQWEKISATLCQRFWPMFNYRWSTISPKVPWWLTVSLMCQGAISIWIIFLI